MGDPKAGFFLLLALLCCWSSSPAAEAITLNPALVDDALKNATTILGVNLPSGALAGAWADLLTLVDAHKGDSKAAVVKLKAYFAQFGYLKQSSNNYSMEFDDVVESAVKLYQQSFRLPVTGSLDAATIAQLVKPRCGREDVVEGVSQMLQNASKTSTKAGHSIQHYSFFPGTPRWISKSSLSYAFDERQKLPQGSSLTEDQVKAAFRKGFARWAAVVPLNFTEVASLSKADITIEFASFNHGDEHAFDGPLGVLAHAFSPEDGRFHMDGSENWATDLKADKALSAIHLESVVVHEIGHLIGLGHSGEAEAIMFPSIGPREVKTEFSQDDVDGAQLLYGANPNYQPGAPTLVGAESQSDASSSKASAAAAAVGLLVAATASAFFL